MKYKTYNYCCEVAEKYSADCALNSLFRADFRAKFVLAERCSDKKAACVCPVSYTHLTLPTIA